MKECMNGAICLRDHATNAAHNAVRSRGQYKEGAENMTLALTIIFLRHNVAVGPMYRE